MNVVSIPNSKKLISTLVTTIAKFHYYNCLVKFCCFCNDNSNYRKLCTEYGLIRVLKAIGGAVSVVSNFGTEWAQSEVLGQYCYYYKG